jgi:hypothetical protein
MVGYGIYVKGITPEVDLYTQSKPLQGPSTWEIKVFCHDSLAWLN